MLADSAAASCSGGGGMEREADWRVELGRFLAPFVARLAHRARRAMCPLHVAGLIGLGDHKSIQPMAARLGLRSHDALHHLVSAGRWDAEPLGAELLAQADRLVGGPEAVSTVDDTALPERGTVGRRGRLRTRIRS